MSADEPTLDAGYSRRQHLINELKINKLESSFNETIKSIAAISEGDGGSGEGTHMGGGEPPHGLKMATESELRASEIAAVEARTDTKIVRLEGKMDLILSKIEDVREDNRHTRHNQIFIGVSLALLIIGVVAAAPVIFDLGSKFRETITKEIQEGLAHQKPPLNIPQ